MMARNRTLTEGRAGSLHLIGGRLCLDFANTSSGRGTDRLLEQLRSYGDLVAWSAHAGLLEPADAAGLSAEAAVDPAAGQKVLRRALGLRDAVYEVFRTIAAGTSPPQSAVDAINEALEAALSHLRVTRGPRGFALGWMVDGPALDRMLWPIARSAAELLSEGPLARVHQCPGPACGWLFLDASKNGKRRWCDMRVCGSRDKARRYHHRSRRAG
jgi:predicted RNA-binding Zn ribbon-like protein